VAWPAPPDGFALRAVEGGALYADATLQGAVVEARLDGEAAWPDGSAPSDAAGRGPTLVLATPAGHRWRLKRLRRGGFLGALWRDRYPTASRPLGILTATLGAASRGVPTARPIAMLLRRGPASLVRAYLAVEELDGFEDLAARARRGALSRGDVAAALATIRAMHDRGVLHPDLNLGNVLVRGGREAAVIDFDRARLLEGAAAFSARQAALRRIERSCAKVTGSPGPLGAGSEDLWYTLYAGDDATLRARLHGGRRVGRLVLAVHRAGWRRS
jgi:hypothetical protein